MKALPLFEIQFGRSKSPSYQEILKRCRKFENFSEGDTNTLIIYDFDEVIKMIYNFGGIIGIASGWKSFSMLYRDQLVESPTKYATAVGKVANCKYAKEKSKDTYYCTENDKVPNWGCRLMGQIGKEPADYCLNWWYEYGHFASGSTYIVDKIDLLMALMSEAKEKMCDNCPYFNEKNLKDQARLLPDEIDIRDTENWKVNFKPIFIGQKQVLLPISIHHTIKFVKYLSFSGEVYQETTHSDSPNSDNIELLTNLDKIDDTDANKLIELFLKNKNNAN